MNLISFTFLIFCIFTIAIYFIVPKKSQWVVLLISSVIFLFWNNLTIATLLQALLVLLSAYIFARLIEKYKDTSKAKTFMLIGVFIILAILFHLKYVNLLISTINGILYMFGSKGQLALVERNSLIGISYYSLIMISYLIDVYRGNVKAEKNIFKCALFMSYFPILTSGPFVRYENMKNELYNGHEFDYKRLCSGLLRVLWGIFKVLVISLRLEAFINTVYGNLPNYNGVFTIVAVLFFPLQLYTNFSGSIDIIMGISEIIGIKLPENFTAPFFSKTLTEFWRNWHITLGGWLRDYIFYPLLKSNFMQKLGKNAKEKFGKEDGKKAPLYLSMLVMWLIIGIWHGGSYTFIIGSRTIAICIYVF